MTIPNLDEHQDHLWSYQTKQMSGPSLPDRMTQGLKT